MKSWKKKLFTFKYGMEMSHFGVFEAFLAYKVTLKSYSFLDCCWEWKRQVTDQTNLYTSISQFYWASEIAALILKVCGNPASSKSISNIVPMPLAHFMCLSHCRNSRNIPYFFSDLWSLIFDVAIVIVFGCHKQHTCKVADNQLLK